MIQRVIFLTLILALVPIGVTAQCSMCSAVVESNLKTGGELAQGLNAGILYLMGIPYALLIGMGIILFRRLNQNTAESESQS
tara:strand:+ start:674 stop:919 length:246 start_codon:yes stop_codon:yes gene_type:complete